MADPWRDLPAGWRHGTFGQLMQSAPRNEPRDRFAEAWTAARASLPPSSLLVPLLNAYEQGDRAGILGMVPENVRRAWSPWLLPLANPVAFMETFSPGAGVRDFLKESGNFTRSLLDLDTAGMLGGLTGMVLGAASIPPGGKPFTKGVTEVGKAVSAPRKVASSWEDDLAKAYDEQQRLRSQPIPRPQPQLRAPEQLGPEASRFTENVYHGTVDDFLAFDMSKAGRTTGSPIAKTGVSVTPDPHVANFYADLAARRRADEMAGSEGSLRAKSPEATIPSRTANPLAGPSVGPSVMPLRLDPGRQGNVRLRGGESRNEIAGAILDAWDAGYDSVRIANIRGFRPGSEFIIVRDPDLNLRSRFAEFRKERGNLMAGIGVPAMTFGALFPYYMDRYGEEQR